MLGVKLICVGKLKESYWRQAVAEYEKRLKPLCRWELIELPEARLSNTPTPGEISAALEKEGEQILRNLSGTVYPLCVEGKQFSSPELAQRLAKAMQSPGSVSFVIGSSYGLSPAVERSRTRDFFFSHDISSSAGPCHALRAALPGISNSGKHQISQVTSALRGVFYCPFWICLGYSEGGKKTGNPYSLLYFYQKCTKMQIFMENTSLWGKTSRFIP